MLQQRKQNQKQNKKLNQNVHNLHAPLSKRAAAKFVDLVAKTAMSIAVGGIFSTKGLILTTCYEVILPVVWQGQTVGKKALNIRFRRVDGMPIHLGTALLRNIGDSLFYFLGIFAAAASNRTIADRLAGTEVIDVDLDDPNQPNTNHSSSSKSLSSSTRFKKKNVALGKSRLKLRSSL
mmetsp:Transcript_488/g.810  ORF Transcript_488/g.810 Transcript_488/m.810 type:complete len:178 (-) Transcript_488:327-860(-)|eukprot:CAMPEP_0197522580 /NCGR_PEP_ID=MMETSP1318-20131121/7698_1 /TAXON_ID=552666 /ORGANISM="Partenskyella glossopodia, Strain RCC365" /LENGTH=177 /DNA_ID=CAMNT_0043074995 /DNA_START=383 /DNA_END=916 /DNA_ORIENTATION=+